MHGDLAPSNGLTSLLDTYDNFHPYIDDTGPEGYRFIRGSMEHHDRMVANISLSTSFTSSGGAIVCSNEHQQDAILRKGRTMIFSGPVNPAALGAACTSAEFHLSNELTRSPRQVVTVFWFKKKRNSSRGYGRNTNFLNPYWGTQFLHAFAKIVVDEGCLVNVAIYPATAMYWFNTIV
jgi:7-keto-8-aminopelargonate synthetase-like enzyme